MRDQLIQYVDLLFAGAYDAEDIKQEILQNTLDRYDDLVSQGKSPEAAYRLAISGIGDINQILGSSHEAAPQPQDSFTETEIPQDRRCGKAAAVALYIASPIPLFLFSEFGLDTLGLCLTLILVAAATALVIMSSRTARRDETEAQKKQEELSPKAQLRKSINSAISVMSLAVYLILSFATRAWFITWLIFPISGAVKGLIGACLDLKEAN